MPNVVTTHLDPRPVALGAIKGVEALVYFAAADDYAKGTLLGRKVTSADSYVGVIVGTGVKTITLTARAGKSLKPGAYVLTVGNVTAGVGPGTLVDPDGISASVTLATSGAHQVPSLGVDFAVTAGGTELDDNATVTWTVAEATGKPLYAPYSSTGVNGAQNPNAVLLDALSRSTGGNEPARVVYKGEVNKALLVVDGGGNVTLGVVDQLRVNGIDPVSASELGKHDNTAPTP